MTPSITKIPTGLVIDSQIPLDNKVYFIDEASLINLGTSNQLAFTYYKGMLAYCATENTEYRWKELESGDVGLRPTNFTYPNNWQAEGIDYSNKVYNFVNVEVEVESTQNNIVRYFLIFPSDLPEDYTQQDVCDYILALPEDQRVILEDESKWNIIIANFID